MCKKLGQVGLVSGVIALICLIIALSVNDISGYSYSSTYDNKLSCGWNKYEITLAGATSSGVEYSDCCDNDSISIGNCCGQRDSGRVFLAFGVISILISSIAVICGILAAGRRAHPFIRWIFLICALLVFIAIGSWTGTGNDENNGCYDMNDNLYVGGSLVLYLIAAIFYCTGFCCTFRQKRKGAYDTLL